MPLPTQSTEVRKQYVQAERVCGECAGCPPIPFLGAAVLRANWRIRCSFSSIIYLSLVYHWVKILDSNEKKSEQNRTSTEKAGSTDPLYRFQRFYVRNWTIKSVESPPPVISNDQRNLLTNEWSSIVSGVGKTWVLHEGVLQYITSTVWNERVLRPFKSAGVAGRRETDDSTENNSYCWIEF